MIHQYFVRVTIFLFATLALFPLCANAQEDLRPFNTIQPMTGQVSGTIFLEPGEKVTYRITMQDYDTYQSISHPSMLVNVLDEYVLPIPQTIHSMKPGYTCCFLGFDKTNIATWIISGTAVSAPGHYQDIWLLTNPNPNPSMVDPSYSVVQGVWIEAKQIDAPSPHTTPNTPALPEQFRQSQAQKNIAAQGATFLRPFRTMQNEQSDALKTELRKALTKAQQDNLARNETVDLDVNSLPATIQTKAREYIKTTIENAKPYFSGPVYGAAYVYTLVLRPETGLNIGIKSRNLDGGWSSF